MKSFIVMLRFFTRIPIPTRFDITEKHFVEGIVYTPIIALIIGLPLWGISHLIVKIDSSVVAVLLMLVYLYISGGLHIDGMADTMDAFGSNRSREKMLSIMKDSSIGTFGVLAIVIYVVGMILIFTKTVTFQYGAAILLYPLVGRTTELVCARMNIYARDKGMGKSFVNGVKTTHCIFGILLFTLISYSFSIEDFINFDFNINIFFIQMIAFFLSLGLVVLLVHFMSKKLNGVTGDVIGFSIETSQFAYLYLIYILSTIGI